MKMLVVCLLALSGLVAGAPSDVITPSDVAAPSATLADSSSSSSSSAAVAKEAADPPAAAPAETPAGALGGPPADVDKGKSEEKSDVPAEPVVEIAEPAKPPAIDIPVNPPVKKVPVYVPVEHAGAFHPDNFFNAYPLSSSVVAPPVAFPYRSVVNPWYQLVSPEVPILTLYPTSDVNPSSRGTVVACAEPSLRYIPGALPPMVYTGPAAASPYAANQFAANALAGGNPNPYGNQVPYYRISHVPGVGDISRGLTITDPSGKYIHGSVPMVYTGPAAASPYAANQFAANALAGGNPNPYGNRVPYYKISPVPSSADIARSSLLSSISPIPRVSSVSPISPDYGRSDSLSVSPLVNKISPQDAVRLFMTLGRREYAAEPNSFISF